MKTLIEYTYSSILNKHVVRTKNIIIKGRGVKHHHNQDKTGLYNVYSLTRTAFDKIYSQYESQIQAF